MHLYWLEQCAADVPLDNSWLTAAEAVRLQQLCFPKRRADWRLGRWTAKCAVAAYLDGPAPSEIEIRAAASGVPEVFISDCPAPVTISLSHRSGLGLCAVVRSETALGCDLELLEPHSALFVAEYFTVEEQLSVAQTPPSARDLLVSIIWSAKESALKAMGVGLRADTREVVVCGLDVAIFQRRADWHTFEVWNNSNVFQAWWRQAGEFVRTVVAPAGVLAPLALRSLAGARLLG